MKRFINRSILFLALIIVVIFSLLLTKIIIVRNFSYKIPEEKHILFMGASHVVHAIDDKLIEGSLNLASPSERYMFTYLKLKYLLRDNNHIDTVFLQFAPTDVWENTDDKYFNDNDPLHFIPMYAPLFGNDEISIYKNYFGKLLKIFLSRIDENVCFTGNEYIKKWGGFQKATEQFNSSNYKSELIVGSCGHKINHNYLRSIIDLCNDKNIKLYLLYCPVYKPEMSYDQQYYYDTYKTNFSDVELLDYSKYVIEDSLRMDAHHLNGTGAIRFTNELKKTL